jgi:hypothetical protein
MVDAKELTITYSRIDIPTRLTTKVHLVANKKAFYGQGLDSNGFFLIQGAKQKGTVFEGGVVYGGKFKLQLNGVMNQHQNDLKFKGSWKNLANNTAGEFELC